MTREAEFERIKRLIAELERAGVTLYKLSLLCDVQLITAQRWKKSGKVWSWYARRLEEIHRQTITPPMVIGPHYSTFVTTSTLRADS